MKAMMAFHDESQKAVAQGQSWAKIREATGDIQSQLRSMKFELPSDGEEKVSKKVSTLQTPGLSVGDILIDVAVRGPHAEDDGQVRISCGRVDSH